MSINGEDEEENGSSGVSDTPLNRDYPERYRQRLKESASAVLF
jgi:hypothetical protein